MKGFRVEGQQLGVQTETVANLGECCHFGHATKLRSFKSRNTHEDPGFGGPIPVTVGIFETKVRPSRGFRVYTMVPPCYPPSMLPPAPPCAAGGGVVYMGCSTPLVPLLCSG